MTIWKWMNIGTSLTGLVNQTIEIRQERRELGNIQGIKQHKRKVRKQVLGATSYGKGSRSYMQLQLHLNMKKKGQVTFQLN